MENTTNISVNIPPKIFKRNEFGLIEDPSVSYIFNEDGTVNWRKMVKQEYLKPNKQYFQRFNKPVPETPKDLEDHELIILLGGLKEIAQVRGYKSVEHSISSASGDYIASVCKIVWIPNYESEGREITFSSIGDAHPNNTTGFTKNYLGAIAENRAFVRCIRNFLKINIVSQEEIGGNGGIESTEEIAPNNLKEAMEKYSIPFEAIKKKLIEEGYSDAEALTDVSQIKKFKQFELAERIRKKAIESGRV